MKCLKILWIFLFIFSGCGDNEVAVKIDLSIKEKVLIKNEPGAITYAYLPQYSHIVSHARHHKLVAFLRQETGLNIQQVFPDTFDQHMKMVGQGKIDISYSNPFIYVKMASRYGAKAFARVIEQHGKETFKGQIITRKGHPSIKSIEDCRGKSWIAVDETSAGGYLYPLGLFIDHGIRKNDFSQIVFAPGPGGKQEKVILSVYAGKYDIGTIREGSLEVVSGKIDIHRIQVVARTKAYPGWVYAAGKDVNPDTIKKLMNAFIKLDMDTLPYQQILKAANFIKVIPSQDSEFNSVRQLAEKVGD